MSRRHLVGEHQPALRALHPALAEPAPREQPQVQTPQHLAFRLVIELYRACSGRALEHKRLNRIAATAGIMHPDDRAAAVAHAVALGLVDLADPHSICLTDEGRRLLR